MGKIQVALVNSLSVPIWFSAKLCKGMLQFRVYDKEQAKGTLEIKPGSGYKFKVDLMKAITADKEIMGLFSVIPVNLNRPLTVSYLTNPARDTVVIDIKPNASSLN